METKKFNLWGVIFGVLLMGVGVYFLWDSVVGKSSQNGTGVPMSGTVYYGTYIGDQYIYEGVSEAIKRNYAWNKDHLTDNQYEVTNVCYNGEILIQILPSYYGNLSIFIQVPHNQMSKFKSVESYPSFMKGTGDDEYCAVCNDDISMAAKISSDLLEHYFNVPRNGELTFNY